MKYEVIVRHLHPGNSTDKQRHKSSYVTVAELRPVGEGEPIYKTTARCRKGDTPNRQFGRYLAVDRMAHYIISHMPGKSVTFH